MGRSTQLESGEALAARDGDGDEAVAGEGEDAMEAFFVRSQLSIALGRREDFACGGRRGEAGGARRRMDVVDALRGFETGANMGCLNARA